MQARNVVSSYAGPANPRQHNMFGLIVVIALAVYLAFIVAVTLYSWRSAKKKKLPLRTRFFAATLGFLIVYLPVFWDHIPTVLIHGYYCDKEAGFWIYKGLHQWKLENPGVLEKLVARKGDPHSHTSENDNESYVDTYFLNERFNMIESRRGKLFLNRWRHERLLIDAKTNDVLGKYVDFSTSQQKPMAGWSGWKLWLQKDNCQGGMENAISSANWIRQFKGVEQ
jgi:hypothetical protein